MKRQNWPWAKRSYSAKSGEWSDRPGFSRHGRGSVSGATKPAMQSFGGYRVYTVGDSWKTSLDPATDFDSEADVKNFIKHWNMESRKRKFNPNVIQKLRGQFARLTKRQNSLESAEALAEGFHGRAPLDDIHVTEEEVYSREQAVIGILEELEVVSEDGMYCTPINFKHHDHRSAFARQGKESQTVYVTFPSRHSIEFIGGDQKLPIEDDKTLVVIGPVFSISYWTDKHHLSDGTGFSSYQHHFGEESVKMNNDKPSQSKMLERLPFLPLLVYNAVNHKLMLVGGVYTVRDEGISN